MHSGEGLCIKTHHQRATGATNKHRQGWTNRRVVTAGVARQSRALTASPMCAGPALPGATGPKTVYARFYVFPGVAGCHFASARRPRGKQPRPETSVAGTAIQDPGHNRAQRGQNPGITQNRA